jgi:thiamine-phosphate pyrophosphorylase
VIAPRLIVITDFTRFEPTLAIPRIARLLGEASAGTVLLQLREHAMPVRRRLELGRELSKLARDAGQLFGVNDRIDLALVLEADALHLGERSVEAIDARTLVPEMWISRALHGLDDLAPRGADALVLSPIFEARHGRPALGLDALRGPKLYALGGVSSQNAAACLAAGAAGVAVVGAALGGDEPLGLLEALGIRRSA